MVTWFPALRALQSEEALSCSLLLTNASIAEQHLVWVCCFIHLSRIPAQFSSLLVLCGNEVCANVSVLALI